MKVEVSTRPDGLLELVLDEYLAASNLTEHDLRDLEFVLAQRRAMARRCPVTWGEHTCALAPGHGAYRLPGHVCRACTDTWNGEDEPGGGDDEQRATIR